MRSSLLPFKSGTHSFLLGGLIHEKAIGVSLHCASFHFAVSFGYGRRPRYVYGHMPARLDLAKQ